MPRTSNSSALSELSRKISDRSGTCHWAPVHDLGTVRGRAFYVTQLLSANRRRMIKGRVKVSARALYSLIRGVIRGLEELNQLCPPPARKSQDIKRFDRRSGPRSNRSLSLRSLLRRPAPGEKPRRGRHECIGAALFFQLVTHRPFPEVGGWPIQTSAEWQRLGRRGKDWLAFCNQLLDPLTDKPMNLAAAAAAAKNSARRRFSLAKHVMSVVVAACVAVAAFGIYKFIQPRRDNRESCQRADATGRFAAGGSTAETSAA